MTEQIFAGTALGISISTYFCIWYLQRRQHRHVQFMLWNYGARLDLIEKELDMLEKDLGWVNNDQESKS